MKIPLPEGIADNLDGCLYQLIGRMPIQGIARGAHGREARILDTVHASAYLATPPGVQDDLRCG